MKVYGHRGASGYAPENTMAAFQLAVEMGAYGIELDVQLTKDGRLVIFHDDRLTRTARLAGQPVEGMVCDYTLQELRAMEVGSWMGPQWQGERIPTMEEVFGWMQANTLQVNIEIKVPAGGYRRELTEQVLLLAKDCGVEDRILISSFYHPALADSRQILPQVPTGILYSEELYHGEAYADIVGAAALHPYHMAIDDKAVRLCQAAGKQVNVWTPNREEEIWRCVAMGVDGIITNYPDRALDLVKEAEQ